MFFCRLVNDSGHWELLLAGIALDVQELSLQAPSNFSNLVSESRWCKVIGTLVAQASNALKVASCFNDFASSTALQEFDKSFRLGLAQVAMKSLHMSKCFRLQCRLKLGEASSDLLLLRDGKAIVPKLSRVAPTESSCNYRCPARLIVLQARGASAKSRCRSLEGTVKPSSIT